MKGYLFKPWIKQLNSFDFLLTGQMSFFNIIKNRSSENFFYLNKNSHAIQKYF